MRLLASAVTILLVSASPGLADDSSWTGGYLGLALGYIDASDTWESSTPAGEPQVTPEGITFSAYGGYGVDLEGLVLGVETELSWPDLSDNATCDNIDGIDCNFDVSMMLSVRARAGIALGPTLIYATGGPAVGYIEAEATDPTGTSASKGLVGYTVGAGFEHQTGSIRYGIEYRHSDYGDVRVDLGTPVGDLNLETDEVRARIAIVFD